jgi:tetratricopeptide (TPR) repeat protein
MLSLQRALRANPDLVEAHRLKSQLHARIGEVDQAIAILQDLLKRGFVWPDIHFEMAELERQRGRAPEARSHLYTAIRLNPDFEAARGLLERMAA